MTITVLATYNIRMKILLVPVAALAFALTSTPLAAGSGPDHVASFLRDAHAAAPGCPPIAAKPLSSTTPSVGRALVPRGGTSLLLCRYYGLNPAQTARQLERMRLVSSAAWIARLTAELDSLPTLRRGIFCPFDDGREIVATFRYPRAPADVVDIGLAGCRIISNGRLSRTAIGPTGGRLLAQLTMLVP